MSDQNVAFRYAKSLIGLAREKGVLEQVYADMRLFEEVSENNRQFMLTMRSPIVKHHKKMEILEAIFRSRVNPVTYSIFEIITRKNREALLYAIAEEFVRQYRLEKGIQQAHLTTATELTEAQRQYFSSLVAAQTGHTVQLVEKVNPDLIGGYILQVNDRQLDNSVRSKLNELRLQMAD